MALVEVKVPDIGDFAEVEIIELLVKPGDTIRVEQSLLTVESDKASMEIPSSHAGVVKELRVKLGDKIAEGGMILVQETAAAAAAAAVSSTLAPAAAAPAPAVAAPAAAPAAAACAGPVIASTDYMKNYAEQIRAFMPKGRTYRVLGTDGFGRSDFRVKLREHFEVNRHYIVIAALKALADEGALPLEKVALAIARYAIKTDKQNPLHA